MLGKFSDRLLGIDPEAPLDYFRRTRPKETPPAWIKGEEDGASFANFLIRLVPLPGDLQLPRLEEGGAGIEWESRKPGKCPRGIRSDFSAS